jgi:hypothetical protein
MPRELLPSLKALEIGLFDDLANPWNVLEQFGEVKPGVMHT